MNTGTDDKVSQGADDVQQSDQTPQESIQPDEIPVEESKEDGSDKTATEDSKVETPVAVEEVVEPPVVKK